MEDDVNNTICCGPDDKPFGHPKFREPSKMSSASSYKPSFYTNRPNVGVLFAAKTVLDNYRMGRQRPINSSLCKSLEMIQTMNNFDFADHHNLQVGGSAMGTKVAMSFASTYMGWFEDRFVYTYPLQPLIWVRFIDDIFQIRTHGAEELEKFEHLNHCVDLIEFETDTSLESVHYLDDAVS